MEQLLGELLEFKRQTLDELKRVREQIEDLRAWKWKITGGAAVISALVALLVSALKFMK